MYFVNEYGSQVLQVEGEVRVECVINFKVP